MLSSIRLTQRLFGFCLVLSCLGFDTATGQGQLAQHAPGSTQTHGDSTVRIQRMMNPGSGLLLPIDIVAPDWTTDRYVVDMLGFVRIWRDDEILTTPYLDMTGVVTTTGITGLRGFAFHPQYATNGFAYVWYDFQDNANQWQIGLARYQRSASDPLQADASSFTQILTAPQQDRGHGSSRLEFGPDGMLYAMLGDGGLQGDPSCNAQNHASLMGSMIRIDVDSAFPYAIPPDNPFIGDPNIRDECWHLGTRHPWRWSFDSLTGALWIADVGQHAWEEINFVPAGQKGLNFGWSVKEGTDCFLNSACGTLAPPCTDPGYTDPIYQYDHSQGCSVTGGLVYRGNAIPDMHGRYFFADYCTGAFWSLRWDGTQAVDVQTHATEFVSINGGALTQPIAFAEDHDGEMLIIDFTDKEIYKMVEACAPLVVCQGGLNSTGQRAGLEWSGSTSTNSQDLRMHVTHCPPGSFGTLFYGSQTVSFPVGGGELCIGSPNGLSRLPTFLTNSLGRGHTELDFQSPPIASGPGAISAGSTWYFQAWYRDPGGVGALNSNLSATLQVYFCN